MTFQYILNDITRLATNTQSTTISTKDKGISPFDGNQGLKSNRWHWILHRNQPKDNANGTGDFRDLALRVSFEQTCRWVTWYRFIDFEAGKASIAITIRL